LRVAADAVAATVAAARTIEPFIIKRVGHLGVINIILFGSS